MKLTKTTIEKLPAPSLRDGKPTQAFYRDEELTCFGIRVTSSGSKSFIVEKFINGRSRRITLGRFGDELTPEQARKKAQEQIGKIAAGVDPATERKEIKAKGVTFEQVFTDYLRERKTLKASTKEDYRKVVDQNLSDWKLRPFVSINKDMVQKKHALIGGRSPSRANYSMRLTRALFNFARGQYENENGESLFPSNPVERISKTRSWYRVDRKKTYIKPHQMPAWWGAVNTIGNDSERSRADDVRDWLLLMLLTGLRHEEALRLRSDQVDLNAKTLTIPDPKNHEPHVLPLSDFLHELLAPRVESATGPFVFGKEEKPKEGPISRSARDGFMEKVVTASGVSFTPHDLRRTFTTIAEGLDISAYAVKRLLNHKMKQDVTAGYIMQDIERLRRPMQLITDHVLTLAGTRRAKVLKLRAAVEA